MRIKQLFLLFTLLLNILALKIHASTLSLHVQGGSQASTLEFPFAISIQYQQTSSSAPQHICGGSIIGRKYILTAAHCNFEENGSVTSPSKLTVVYGTNVLSSCPSKVGSYSTCQRVQVKSITNHERYNGDTVVNDIAIYELANEINLPANHIALIPLSNAAVGTSHYIVGWGLTNDKVGEASNTLMKGLAPIVEDKFCNALGLDMSSSTKGQLCAGSGNGIDACSGDSGGGLAMQVQVSSSSNSSNNGNSTSISTNSASGSDALVKLWVASGVVSYGPSGCGVSDSVTNRGVYTSVANFKNWIVSKIPSSSLIFYTGNGVVVDQGGGVVVINTACTNWKFTKSNIGFYLFLGFVLFLFTMISN